mmetsp:Transcript_65333/g.145809  ORF Transcript_65333/g.145809 Transcript_65333/m.145809 type:complete len:101 (+) Transcript_65333:556-858(+)
MMLSSVGRGGTMMTRCQIGRVISKTTLKFPTSGSPVVVLLLVLVLVLLLLLVVVVLLLLLVVVVVVVVLLLLVLCLQTRAWVPIPLKTTCSIPCSEHCGV